MDFLEAVSIGSVSVPGCDIGEQPELVAVVEHLGARSLNSISINELSLIHDL